MEWHGEGLPGTEERALTPLDAGTSIDLIHKLSYIYKATYTFHSRILPVNYLNDKQNHVL